MNEKGRFIVMSINIKKKFFHVLKKKSSYEKKIEQWNLPVWDMHCHILPEVDDGAGSMEDSLKMIEQEISEGVNKIMLTPHYRTGNADLIKEQFKKLECEVRKRNYSVEMYLGNELLYSSDIIEELQAGRALTLAGSSYVLVEFQTGITYQWMKQAFQELLMAGYRPILAHMERFECLWHQEERVDELIDLGIYMQANSNSFLREDTAKTLMKLTRKGKIHFVGTDSHRPDWRPPKMKTMIQKWQKNMEKEGMIQILVENPNDVLKNHYI